MHHYKNPQANAILERIHQVVSSMLKTKYLANVKFDAVVLWGDIFTYIVYAVRCSYHSTLQYIHVQLVFGWDMLLDINFQPNYKEMWLRNRKLIDYNNKGENSKQVQYDYEVVHYTYILRNGNQYKIGRRQIRTV